MKKKIASLSMLLCFLAIFFYIPVNAVSWKGSAYDTDQVGDVIMDTHVYSLNYEAYDNTNTPYKFILYVTVRLQNLDSDEPAYISQPRFTISPGDGVNSSYISIENYSVDLLLSVDSGIITISCDDQFSYGTGIVIPPNSSLYAIGKVELATNSFSWTPSVVNATYTSTTSSVYSYGQHIDYSPIIDYLNNAATHLDVNNVLTVLSQFYMREHDDLEDVKTELQDVINNLVYSGLMPSYSFTNGSKTTAYLSNVSSLNLRADIFRYVGEGVLIDSDTEILNGNDTYYQNATVRYPFFIRWVYRNNTGKPVATYFQSYTFPVFPNVYSSSFNVTGFMSNVFDSFDILYDGKIRLIYSLNDESNSNRGIIPTGNTYMMMFGYLDVPYGSNISWPSLSITEEMLNPTGNPLVVVDDYYPKNEYQILRDIYLTINDSTVQNQGTVNESNTTGALSDQVHAQEEQWYHQNDIAMENVGLSNYRYTQNQQTGIAGAVLQFEQMWLALGDWTLVYIFTLMLSLAVFILRHEPTTRMKQAREERSAFYAESGRYYKESARPSIEFVQSVRKFNGK